MVISLEFELMKAKLMMHEATVCSAVGQVSEMMEMESTCVD